MTDIPSKLTGVHPELVGRVVRILAAMQSLNLKMMVTDGVRTLEQQAALYAQGRTTPGPIVTHCDGVLKRSNHQPHDDGFGHAVDCCFMFNGAPSWDKSLPWMLYGSMAQQQGLVWGGTFKTIVDLPHVELP